jgi:hypothetical protein
MRYLLPLRSISILSLLLCGMLETFGYPGKHLKLDELVSASDVIAVVEVSEPHAIARVVTNLDGKDVRASQYKVEMRLERLIKGTCPDQFDTEFYLTDEFIGYPGLETGPQLIFLKDVGGRLVFSDPHFPSFPAVAGSGTMPAFSDPIDAVLDEMGAEIASSQSTADDKLRILQIAYALPNVPSFRAALRAGLEATSDDDLRYRIEAHLLMRNDLADLPSIAESLSKNALSEHERDMLLSVIETKIVSSEALPSVRRLLQSAGTPLRRAAAQALWHIADKSSQDTMIAALSDPDREVRFYAIRGLAETTGQREWGPSSPLIEEDEQEYLKHWHAWAATRANADLRPT